LKFFIDYRQRNWLEWLVIAEFTVNNTIYLAMNVLLFMANYRRELRMETNIKRKGKVEKAVEFVERIKMV